MGTLWEKGWLVKLELKNGGTGSGIVLNQEGFILTAFHNVYGNTDKEHIIQKVKPSKCGSWGEAIPDEENNISVQCSELTLARKLDLVSIQVKSTAFQNRPPIKICQERPIEGQNVVLLNYDSNDKDNNWREEPATINKPYPTNGYWEFSINKVRGIEGASGGGVFTEDGKLLGIIKQRRKDTEDYVATWVGSITRWLPEDAPYIRVPDSIVPTHLRQEVIKTLSKISLPKNTINNIYSRTAPKGWYLPNPTIESEFLIDVINFLANTIQQSDGSHPMLKFVFELSNHPEATAIKTELVQWLQDACLALSIDLNTLITSSPTFSRKPHLLIKLKNPVREPLFTVTAWVFCRKYRNGHRFFQDKNLKSLHEISTLFHEIYEKSWGEIDQDLDKLSIAFILPTKYINHEVYSWTINPGISETPVGTYHCVTIRSFERIYTGKNPVFHKCKDKWEQFKEIQQYTNLRWRHEKLEKPIQDINTSLTTLNECGANNIILSKESSSTSVTLLFEKFFPNSQYSQLNASKCLGLILIVDIPKTHVEATFKKILNSGIPVILWVNKESQIEHYKEVLDLLVPITNLANLPELVLEKRQSNQEITLLWEDFDILPPDITNPLRQLEESE